MKSLVFILSLLLVTGCAMKAAPPLHRMEREHMWQQLQQRQRQLTSLSALTQVKLVQGEKSWSATQALLVETPNRLRLDMVNFFGQLLVQLVVDGPRLDAYVPAEKTHYHGVPTLDNVQRFTGLPLPVTDLVAVLLCRLPHGVLETAQVRCDDDALLLTVSEGVEFRVTFMDNQVTAVVYSVNDYVLYRVDYGEWNAQSNFPKTIELQVPMSSLSLKLRFDEVERNPEFSSAQFELLLPAATLRRALSELEETR